MQMNGSSAEGCCDTDGSSTSFCSAVQNPLISLEGPGHEVATDPKHITVTSSSDIIHLGCCLQPRKISKYFWKVNGEDVVVCWARKKVQDGVWQWSHAIRPVQDEILGFYGLPHFFFPLIFAWSTDCYPLFCAHQWRIASGPNNTSKSDHYQKGRHRFFFSFKNL